MIRLVPFEPSEFATYLDGSVRSYAEENVRAGRWSAEEALSEAQKQIQGLLPQGLHTPNNYFFSIRADPSGEPVGIIWLAVEPRGGFVYDLNIFEAHRRRGYAEAAMRQIEGVARDHGAQKISLHVFGDNSGARRLYLKLGYSETNVMMSKPLPPHGSVT
jgi:ribosomal protein S18 acetylase RimI-like enzyme